MRRLCYGLLHEIQMGKADMKANRVILLLAMIAAIAAYPAGPQEVQFTESNFFAGPAPYAMYVESFLPAKPTHKTPIVLIHGCCTTGAGFVSTPDGREGWAKYFVRNGWNTYVVDQPGHGRSPMPEDFSTMSLQHAVDDNVALLKKIGPSIFLVHSIGGMIGWKLCETVPDQVAAIIGVAPVPPANMPKDSFPAAAAIGQSFRSSGSSGAGPYLPEDKPAWYKLEAAKKAFASASLFPVEAMDQYYASLVPESPRSINELMNKDGMGLTADPKKFANVPKVIVTGDEDPRHPRAVDAQTAKFLGADHIYLADVGLPGHGHPMYLDKGNEKIAQLILDWLAKKGL
jgi:pimeloyl-ACP methyl ester carboxylesterase